MRKKYLVYRKEAKASFLFCNNNKNFKNFKKTIAFYTKVFYNIIESGSKWIKNP